MDNQLPMMATKAAPLFIPNATSKRDRYTASGSGTSPTRKRHCDVINKATEKKRLWSDEEISFLVCTRRSQRINVDWIKIAAVVNEKFLHCRTATSCRLAYRQYSIHYTDKNTKEIGVQTIISVCPRDKVVWDNVRTVGESTEVSNTRDKQATGLILRSLLESPDLRSTSCGVDHLTNSFAPLPSSTPCKEINTHQSPSSGLHDSGKGTSNSEDVIPFSLSHDHGYGRLWTSTPAKSSVVSKQTTNDVNDSDTNAIFHDHAYVKGRSVPKKTVNIHTKKKETPPSERKPNLKLTLIQIVRLKAAVETKYVDSIANAVLSIPILKQSIMDEIAMEVGERPETMRNKKHGFVSVLMAKDFCNLKEFDVSDIVNELRSKFPEMYQIAVAMMFPKEQRHDPAEVKNCAPRLAMLYGILLQSRVCDLSLVQRVVSALLTDNICDQKIYDRLNTLGVCLSYMRTSNLLKHIGQHYTDVLHEAAKGQKHIRFIGDNIDFMVGVRNENLQHHSHMVHMFGSAALISEHHFISLPLVPQIPIEAFSVENVIPSAKEYDTLKDGCIVLIVETLKRFLPRLSFIAETVPKTIPVKRHFKVKTEVVPLPVLPCNEQYYQDTVKILQFYEEIAQGLVTEFGPKEQTTQFHIGGDQLTRERFSGAKKLRLGNLNPPDQFSHLGTITCEFFHLGMNYLEKMIFKSLWKDKGIYEIGTLKGEAERMSRKSVNPNVKSAYDPDKEFFLSFLEAYIVEALLHFFGMDCVNDAPTRHIPPNIFNDPNHQNEWVYSTLGKFVDEYVFPHWSGKGVNKFVLHERRVLQRYKELVLSNGTRLRVPMKSMSVETIEEECTDIVKNYAHHVLEVGLIFRYFLHLMKTPDRERLLGLFKFMMLHLKARNPKAKYPLELLRLLMQQYCHLPLREACQVLQDCFVNTLGKFDTHVPADLQMEWVVKNVKAHMGHMYSNKTESNINAMSSALHGISIISKKFDATTGVIVRSKKHSKKEARQDEIAMIKDLQTVRPFVHQPLRFYEDFPNIPHSPMKWLDIAKFQMWFLTHKFD